MHALLGPDARNGGDTGLYDRNPMKRALGALGCALTVSGCAHFNQPPPGPPVTLEEVIRQIKSDVGQYNVYATEHLKDVPLNNACGGKIDLFIKTVTVSVTTVTKASQDATLGAEVSPNAFIKLGASGGRGWSTESSQGLTFTLVPAATGVAQPQPVPPSQLYLALKDLRESLLRASDATPCLRFPEKEQENTLQFGFQATKTNNMSVGVNLFIFAIGFNKGSERTAAHTIKIGFEGTGQAIQ
jgi:hypothetical protein